MLDLRPHPRLRPVLRPLRFIDAVLGEDPIGFNSGTVDFYPYVANSPVNLIDPSGETIGVKGDYLAYLTAMLYLEQSPSAKGIIEELQNSPELYMIHASDLITEDAVDPHTMTTVYWNPHQALCVKNGEQSPAIQRLHEMVHLLQHKHHVKRFGFDPQGNYVNFWEEPAVQGTNRAATQLGEPSRLNYRDAGKNPVVILPIIHSQTDCACEAKH